MDIILAPIYLTWAIRIGKRITKNYLTTMKSLLRRLSTPLDKNNVKVEELLNTLNYINGAIQFTMVFVEK